MLQTTQLTSLHPLIRATARTLRTNLGAHALAASHIAIGRMRALGDQEGLDLWLELHAALTLMDQQGGTPAGSAPKWLH